jgi:tRNA(Arg) A34 adenosine deaminase TadA
MFKLFRAARDFAIKRLDNRAYIFGAIGIRNDGTTVVSRNICNVNKDPRCHAEFRLAQKLDRGAVVYVVRVSRSDLSLKPARPCFMCERTLRASGVEKVLYSISDHEFGVLHLQ